jgi:regulator of cell morphogenesis and NO signaling
MLDSHQTVADLVLDHSECAEVLARHRIDFCCRGDVSIEAAALARGITPDILVDELSRAIEGRTAERANDPRALSTPRLIAHIVATHHDYTRTALPFIATLAAKVSRVHGDHNPKLRALATAVDELVATLIPHLDEEEQSLFPMLMASSVDGRRAIEQLGAMEEEHHAVGALLERIRAASDDFTLPEWACNSYRTLFSELGQLERDVHVHVHLENHVLKPRFVASERTPLFPSRTHAGADQVTQ